MTTPMRARARVDDAEDARPRDATTVPRPTRASASASTRTHRRRDADETDARVAAMSAEVRALRETLDRLEREKLARVERRRDVARARATPSTASAPTGRATKTPSSSSPPRELAAAGLDDELAAASRFRARCRASAIDSSIVFDDASTPFEAVTRQFTLGVVKRLPEDARRPKRDV